MAVQYAYGRLRPVPANAPTFELWCLRDDDIELHELCHVIEILPPARAAARSRAMEACANIWHAMTATLAFMAAQENGDIDAQHGSAKATWENHCEQARGMLWIGERYDGVWQFAGDDDYSGFLRRVFLRALATAYVLRAIAGKDPTYYMSGTGAGRHHREWLQDVRLLAVFYEKGYGWWQPMPDDLCLGNLELRWEEEMNTINMQAEQDNRLTSGMPNQVWRQAMGIRRRMLRELAA
ncbi:MAG: hypothetical protein M1815_001606 [Lichina confinis]|nr:MAG: hypothetical protein M1815_001606 [Lichina confinis]